MTKHFTTLLLAALLGLALSAGGALARDHEEETPPKQEHPDHGEHEAHEKRPEHASSDDHGGHHGHRDHGNPEKPPKADEEK